MLASVEIMKLGILGVKSSRQRLRSGHWELLDTQLGVPRTTAAAVALDAERILETWRK